MKELSRIRRSSLGGSSSSLARRSSISQKDILALQETLQKQQKISEQVILGIFVTLPPATFLLFYSISIHNGVLIPTVTNLFTKWPFLHQCVPPLMDPVAWKFTIVHSAIQLIFYWALPYDHALIISSAGNEQREINGFFSFLLTCLLYVLGASSGFYSGDLVYAHFSSIILIFAIISIFTLAYLSMSYYFGDAKYSNPVSTLGELYFGIEAHPKILDIDLKSFIRTRFTFMIWPLYIISVMYSQNILYGRISNSLYCLGSLQLLYIAKFHWNEDLYLNSLDSKRSNLGFYRIWIDLVCHPVIYTSPITVLAHSNKSIGLISISVFSILAFLGIVITYKCDRLKYEFRKSKGDLKIGGIDPFFISAKYKTESGDTNVNLLLGSGHWGKCRHPNYTGEAMTFLAFSCFQGFPSFISHIPLLFVIGFLIIRGLHDENRCLVKYGQSWIQYCSKVKYRFLPGVY